MDLRNAMHRLPDTTMMLAEGVRFELTRPFGLPVFKTGAINRSATPPRNGSQRPTSNVQRPTLNKEKRLSVQC